jgi:tRNA pseudouridine38-40 synthase
VVDGERVVRLTLGYCGTRYAGWAKQAPDKTRGRDTVQGVLERTLGAMLSEDVHCVAAGRTDAGVHADGQVVSFITRSPMPALGIRRVLARDLPEDIWVVDAADAPCDFDARRRALRRWYRYAMWRGTSAPSPIRGRTLTYPAPLDVAPMRLAASSLPGRHDLASLAAAGGGSRSTVRTIYAADWLETVDGQLLSFEICADAFLKHMVRTLVGSMLWVGDGTWTPDHLATALAACDRRAAGPTAPACGLTLMRVEY